MGVVECSLGVLIPSVRTFTSGWTFFIVLGLDQHLPTSRYVCRVHSADSPVLTLDLGLIIRNDLTAVGDYIADYICKRHVPTISSI